MNYRAGELTEKVTIRRQVKEPDAAGGYSLDWQDVREEHARVRPMTGSERQAAGRNEAIAGYLVVVRARTDITEADKIVWQDRELNIRFVKDRGPRALYLEIECDRGVAV